MGVDHIAFADDDYDETIDAKNCGALWNNARPLYVLKKIKSRRDLWTWLTNFSIGFPLYCPPLLPLKSVLCYSHGAQTDFQA